MRIILTGLRSTTRKDSWQSSRISSIEEISSFTLIRTGSGQRNQVDGIMQEGLKKTDGDGQIVDRKKQEIFPITVCVFDQRRRFWWWTGTTEELRGVDFIYRKIWTMKSAKTAPTCACQKRSKKLLNAENIFYFFLTAFPLNHTLKSRE